MTALIVGSGALLGSGQLTIESMHFLQWEMAAWASGMAGMSFAVSLKLNLPTYDFITKVIHQFIKSGKLILAWLGLVKIANQANSNSDLIHLIRSNVTTLDLLEPPRADFDFAVCGIDSISDDEMIGEPILHSSLSVLSIIYGRIPTPDATVMTNDQLPPATLNRNLPGNLSNMLGETLCGWRIAGCSFACSGGPQKDGYPANQI